MAIWCFRISENSFIKTIFKSIRPYPINCFRPRELHIRKINFNYSIRKFVCKSPSAGIIKIKIAKDFSLCTICDDVVNSAIFVIIKYDYCILGELGFAVRTSSQFFAKGALKTLKDKGVTILK